MTLINGFDVISICSRFVGKASFFSSIVLAVVALQGCAIETRKCYEHSLGTLPYEYRQAHLGLVQALHIAKSAADREGVDLNHHALADVFYSVFNGKWAFFFEVEDEGRREAVGNSFSISVDAFTGQATISPGY